METKKCVFPIAPNGPEKKNITENATRFGTSVTSKCLVIVVLLVKIYN